MSPAGRAPVTPAIGSAGVMPRTVRIMLSALSFIAFAVGAAVLSWVLIPRHRRRVRALAPDERETARRRFLLESHAWVVDFAAARGLIEVDEIPLPADLPAGPYVLVANHPSLIDVLVLRSRIPGLTCVVRSDLWRRRWLRPVLEFARDIRGPNGASVRVGETGVLDAFVERLDSGDSVLVFPEGTRSPPHGLHRFRRGAIEAAIRARVPVVPVVLHVTPPTLKHGDPWWHVPPRRVQIQVSFLPTIQTNGHSDSAAIASVLRHQYSRALGLASDAGTQAQPDHARPGESSMR